MQPETNRFLSEFSTFGIGGPISHFVSVRTIEEMQSAFAWARERHLPTLVIGKGSNSLFSDEGFLGLAILNKIDDCAIEGLRVTVGSGYSFSLLGSQTARRSLSGLEFASGIPATVGGAIFMNAGANKREACDALLSVTYLHEDGRSEEFLREKLLFSYRKSPFQELKGAIVRAVFRLELSLSAKATQLEIVNYRMKTQPLKEKSIGCIFKNPQKGMSAGALIEECGLKKCKIGGAEVSDIHANFIINTKNASAKDVLELIRIIQWRVKLKTGIELHPEIRVLP